MSKKPKEGTDPSPWKSPDPNLVPGAMENARRRAAALQAPAPDDYNERPSLLSVATESKLRQILTGK